MPRTDKVRGKACCSTTTTRGLADLCIPYTTGKSCPGEMGKGRPNFHKQVLALAASDPPQGPLPGDQPHRQAGLRLCSKLCFLNCYLCSVVEVRSVPLTLKKFLSPCLGLRGHGPGPKLKCSEILHSGLKRELSS